MEGEARAVWAEQRGEERAGVSSEQELEGGSSEDGEERLKLLPRLSPSPFVPRPHHGAARQALTLCVLYQGPERGPLPVSGPPKDTFQDAHSKTGRMPMSLP